MTEHVPTSRPQRGWKALWRRFYPYLRPERRTVIVAGILLLLSVPPGVVGPLLVKRIFDRSLPTGDGAELALLAGVLAGLAIVGHGLRLAERLIGVRLRSRVRYRIGRRLSGHVLRLPLGYFQRVDTGYLMSRVRDDLTSLDALMPDEVLTVLVDALRAAVFLGVLLFLDPELALAGIGLATLLWTVFMLSVRPLRRRNRQALEDKAQGNAALHDALSGIWTVRTTAQEGREARRVGGFLRSAVRSQARRDRLGVTLQEGMGVLGVLGGYGVLVLGAYRVMIGATTLGTLVSFFVLLTQLMGALSGVLGRNAEWQAALAALERILEILDEAPEPLEAPGEDGTVRGRLELDRVSARYDGGPLVLRELSLTVRPGEMVALVGRSGAGKSSLVRLIPRLLEPAEGTIRLDGRRLDELPLATLRRAVGYVPQDIFLFNRSVRENIAYAAPWASEEALRRAARAAHAEEFILELPDGYDTEIGERGVRLSGGQKQRLAIAREILRDPPILIFDEATSSLDTDSERKIRRAIEGLRHGRTLFVIAHRLATVVDADRLALLEEGRIVAVGTHEDLRERSPLYAQLCQGALEVA